MPLTSFPPHIPLADYQARFAEHFVMERHDGILEVRFHTQGGEAVWSVELHRALSQMFQAIGQDPENEVMILTGTGDTWLMKRDIESFSNPDIAKPDYDVWYRDGSKLIENLLWAVDIPTISVINGPGSHTEFGLLCDLTIAAEDAKFFEPHFFLGVVPGDGNFLVYQELLGIKRANHIMYLRETGITAAEALEWGMVGEVLPRPQLMARARQIAEQIMRQPRTIRRLTTQVVKRPWRRTAQDDLGMHLAHEMFGGNLAPRPVSRFKAVDANQLR